MVDDEGADDGIQQRDDDDPCPKLLFAKESASQIFRPNELQPDETRQRPSATPIDNQRPLATPIGNPHGNPTRWAGKNKRGAPLAPMALGMPSRK